MWSAPESLNEMVIPSASATSSGESVLQIEVDCFPSISADVLEQGRFRSCRSSSRFELQISDREISSDEFFHPHKFLGGLMHQYDQLLRRLSGLSLFLLVGSQKQGHQLRQKFLHSCFFFRVGFPTMLISTFFATLWLLLTHVFLGWH